MLHHSTQEMASYLQPGKHVHLIGIGGVSMCALGMVLHGMGIQVTGSDMHQSKAIVQSSKGLSSTSDAKPPIFIVTFASKSGQTKWVL